MCCFRWSFASSFVSFAKFTRNGKKMSIEFGIITVNINAVSLCTSGEKFISPAGIIFCSGEKV